MDTKTQQIRGAMVDLITAIGETQGFKVKVEATPFSALIPYRLEKKFARK